MPDNFMAFYNQVTDLVCREELGHHLPGLSAKHMTLSQSTFSSVNWRGMSLMDGSLSG